MECLMSDNIFGNIRFLEILDIIFVDLVGSILHGLVNPLLAAQPLCER